MRGEPVDLHGPYLLADNGLVHNEMIEMFEEIFEGRYRHDMPGLPAPEWSARG